MENVKALRETIDAWGPNDICVYLYSIGQYFHVLIFYLFDVYVNLCRSRGHHMTIVDSITHFLIMHTTMACWNALTSWSLVIQCGSWGSLGDNKLFHLLHCPRDSKYVVHLRHHTDLVTFFMMRYRWYGRATAEHRSLPTHYPNDYAPSYMY